MLLSTRGICEQSGKRGAHAGMAFVGFCCISKRRGSHVLLPYTKYLCVIDVLAQRDISAALTFWHKYDKRVELVFRISLPS